MENGTNNKLIKLDQLIYDIGEFGFLGDINTTELSKEYHIFNEIIQNLNSQDGNFRELVHKLPKESPDYYLDMIKDKNYSEIKKIYNVFTFICQKYIWCNGLDDRAQSLPYSIGLIWYFCGKDRVVRPVSTYDALILNNWKLVNENEPMSIENLEVLNSITGLEDEKHFYKIHILIENAGRKFINDILCYEEIFKSDELILQFFDETYNMLQDCISILTEMLSGCDPNVFWNVIRIYLSGFEKEKLFPNGLHIEGTHIYLKHKGGSGASSPLIQAIDLFFGVEHNTPHGSELVDDMRKYMSFKHRDFLKNVEKQEFTLDEYVSTCDNDKIIASYNKCLEKLQKFRRVHVAIVHKYIVTKLDQIDEEIKDTGTSKTGKNNAFDKGGSSSLASKSKQNNGLIILLTELITDVKDKIMNKNNDDNEIILWKEILQNELNITFVFTIIILCIAWLLTFTIK